MRRSAILLALLALAGPAAACGGPGGDGGGDRTSTGAAGDGPAPRFFAPDSVWNKPLPRDAPLDRESRSIVGSLRAQVDEARRKTFGPTINWHTYSVPIYTVPADQPKTKVMLDNDAGYAASLRAALEEVPMPRKAKAAAGNDQHLVVWQPSTDTMWEFWKMHRQRDGWHAKSAGRMGRVSENPGYFAGPAGYPWGATATSLPLVGGLILPGELRSGHIPHALAMAVPKTRGSRWSFPAQRTDGFISGAPSVPQGARFRLDPRVNVDELRASRTVKTLARAAQRYGIIVRDTSATPVFYAQDPMTLPRKPYGRLFGREPLDNQLADFPWSRLQLTRMDLRGYDVGG